MKKQLLSFKFALCGVWNTIKNESHMRFHITAAFYVVLFSLFYNFSAVQWAILIILMGLVMALEVLNTCIEELCDLYTDRYEPLVKLIKDGAAGAVLVMSAAAAVVAVIFFWNIDIISSIITFFAANIPLLILLVLSAVLAVLFVILGPVGIKNAVTGVNKKQN